MTLYDLLHGIAALPGHEEDAVDIQLVIPGVIGVTAIDDENAVLGQPHGARGGDVVALAVGDVHERRQQAVMIQANVQFDGALHGAEPGPGKNAEAQANRRGVEGVELVLESEAMARRAALAACQQLGEQPCVQGTGLLLVDPGQ